ncbi:Rieske (2Fe-2S) protein [Trinickia mobilis]|uniref:Rieske (2Fe-2S) protein n=1 Tax=Trinickia mobilis TaxID=2816356 RepID=UPI001A8D860F|nr:Rieske (2Fe-2S) protein [Trinickia mobilis]
MTDGKSTNEQARVVRSGPIQMVPTHGAMTESCFYHVAEIGEFTSANPLRKEVNGWPLLIVRDGEEIHAFRNLCTHAWAPMNAARISEGAIICPFHGAKFDVRTGRCLDSGLACMSGGGLAPLTRVKTRLVGDRVEAAISASRGRCRR